VYDVVTRYLARAFARIPQPEVSLQTYADVGKALGEVNWLPRPLSEVTPLGVAAQRVSLTSRTGDWALNVLSESIDLQYSTIPNSPVLPFSEFCSLASSRLGNILDFLKVRAHRIASIQEGVLPELPEQTLETCFRKLLSSPPPFDEVKAFEWDWRVAFGNLRQFGTAQESVNTIAIVKRVGLIRSDGRESDRLFVSTDINTTPKDVNTRFVATDASAFVSASVEWHRELTENLLKFLGLP
jgi:hypothetical protein